MDWTISQPSAASVQIQTGEGRVFIFNGDGTNWFRNVDVRWHVCTDTNGGWLLDGRDGGGTMRFDTNGLWASTDDGWGNSIAASRDSSEHITNIAHTCGLSLSVSWTNNRISAVAGPDNILRADYFYGSAGLLTGVVRSASSGQTFRRLYSYDPTTNLMTSTVNAIGQSLIYQYAAQDDGSVRCTSSAFSDGSFAGNATWDPSNWLTRVDYPVSAGKSRRETIRWIPTAGRMSWVEQGGQKLDYYYDPTTLSITGLSWKAGTQTAAIWSTLDAAGRPTAEVSVWTGKVGSAWATEWHPSPDLPTAGVDPLGWRTEYTWTNGVVASFRETNGYGGWLTTSLTYSQGLLTAVSDPINRSSLFQYDSQGSLARAIPPVGPSITLTNDLLGNVVSLTLPSQDGAGRGWVFQRDGFGNVTNALAPDGIAVQGFYDAIGNLTGLVDRAGRQVSITYGVMARPLSVSRTIFDNGSNRTVTLATSRDLQMDPTAVIDPLGRKVEAYVRDDAGRISTITNVEGSVATVQYGPADLPLSVTRFDGTTNSITYNGDWVPIASVFPGRTNTFAWLANGLLASAANEQASITNDWIAPGWLTSQQTRTAGWTGQVDYASDLSGAITQVTASAIGLSATRQFDAGGRETNRTQTCNGVQLNSTREYGSWNGLPTRVTTGPMEQTLGWDVLDQLTNLTWQAGSSGVRQIDFQRNVLGQITQRVDRVAGEIVAIRSYFYDDLDRLRGEAVSSGRFAEYMYDDAGRRTSKDTSDFGINYSNGDGDRLAGWSVSRTSLTVSVSGTANKTIGTNTQFGFRQVYNGAGSATPAISGSNFTATLQAEPLGTQTVVALISDLAGNVGVATNRYVLTAYTAGAYSSDAAGCVTQIVYQGPLCQQSRELSWDIEYRLTSVKTNGATAETYGLDPFGRRISTTASDGMVTKYLNDGQHVLADLDSTGGVLKTYFYGPNTDELLAMTVHTGATPMTYIAIRDHQNTIWAWADTNGVVMESYDFDAWGRVLSVTDGSGNVLAASAIGNRFLFQGREYSWATGLYYFRARWYDPVTGRWLSPDPIGINGGLNQYVFCGNDPINFTDPLGLTENVASIYMPGLVNTAHYSTAGDYYTPSASTELGLSEAGVGLRVTGLGLGAGAAIGCGLYGGAALVADFGLGNAILLAAYLTQSAMNSGHGHGSKCNNSDSSGNPPLIAGLKQINNSMKNQFDIHGFKEEMVGSQGKAFNVSVDEGTGGVWLTPVKTGGGANIETGFNSITEV